MSSFYQPNPSLSGDYWSPQWAPKLSLKRKAPSYQRKLVDCIANQEKHKVWFHRRVRAGGTRARLQKPSRGTSVRSPDLTHPGFSSPATPVVLSPNSRNPTFHSQEDLEATNFTFARQQLKQGPSSKGFKTWSGSRRGNNRDADSAPSPARILMWFLIYRLRKVHAIFREKRGFGSQVYEKNNSQDFKL